MANPQFKQETVDPLDIDEYLDFNHGGTFSPSSSASSLSSRANANQTPTINTPRASQMSALKPQPINQNTFTGPRHQYDLHKQTTGLPVGGVASSIAAARQSPFVMNPIVNGFGAMRHPEDVFDFNAMPPATFAAAGDMDMDFDSPVDGLAPSRTGSGAGCGDPPARGGHAEPSPPVRLWPGMHTQQAALAKQQQQQEIMRQQQVKAAAASQQRLANQPAMQRPATAGKATDPLVEERISRLLNQMRHNSHGSSDGGSGSGSHNSRQRKDEEDMDEDELLLASEEGKKLSSKERRQLRNKVSARAFRSRRKGR